MSSDDSGGALAVTSDCFGAGSAVLTHLDADGSDDWTVPVDKGIVTIEPSGDIVVGGVRPTPEASPSCRDAFTEVIRNEAVLPVEDRRGDAEITAMGSYGDSSRLLAGHYWGPEGEVCFSGIDLGGAATHLDASPMNEASFVARDGAWAAALKPVQPDSAVRMDSVVLTATDLRPDGDACLAGFYGVGSNAQLELFGMTITPPAAGGMWTARIGPDGQVEVVQLLPSGEPNAVAATSDGACIVEARFATAVDLGSAGVVGPGEYLLEARPGAPDGTMTVGAEVPDYSTVVRVGDAVYLVSPGTTIAKLIGLKPGRVSVAVACVDESSVDIPTHTSVAASGGTLLVYGGCRGDISIGRNLDHLEVASPADGTTDGFVARVAP